METATFGAETVDGLEEALRELDGVHEARAGSTEQPAFAAVEVDYDPWKVSYDELLAVFLSACDPAQRAAIFPHTVEQHAAAAASIVRLGPAATEIVAGGGRFRRSAPS